MSNIVPILFTFDESLVMPAVVCMTSLLENAASSTFYDIFVLHGSQCDFSQSPLALFAQKYKEKCRIRFRKVVGEFVGGYEIRGIPETAYYRLIAPELIPEYDTIIYSDVDVIFREDLLPYYRLHLGENYFAGVDNCSKLRPDVRTYLKEKLGLDYRKGYYYSGNLVINSRQLLKDRKLEQFRQLGKKAFHQQDMDIINIACNGRFLPLGPSFCLTNFLYELSVTRREDMDRIYGETEIEHALRSGIVHYNGMKPWKGMCLNMDVWWSYYRKSICFDEEFAFGFWNRERNLLKDMTLTKRIKQLLRYPIDKRLWRG
ncbi:MAG: hypothetical protein IJ753_07425 [Bacteroidales bacterium]|nr:hypothetical protein [Bacteroidales bacterium]